jgi:hypothetical protein
MAGVALAGALAASQAQAHHSFAMFDNAKVVSLNGTVSDFKWTNPHMWVKLVVADPVTRRPVEWMIEGPSVNGLSRIGWGRTTMNPGDKVTLSIHPLKSGQPGGSLITATVGGKVLKAHERSAGD